MWSAPNFECSHTCLRLATFDLLRTGMVTLWQLSPCRFKQDLLAFVRKYGLSRLQPTVTASQSARGKRHKRLRMVGSERSGQRKYRNWYARKQRNHWHFQTASWKFEAILTFAHELEFVGARSVASKRYTRSRLHFPIQFDFGEANIVCGRLAELCHPKLGEFCAPDRPC